MTVTEFAILRLASFHPGVVSNFHQALTIQDNWVLTRNPALPPTRVARGVGVLQQVKPSVSSPTKPSDHEHDVLITAQWDSPAAHMEWIATGDNKDCMGLLTPLLKSETEGVVTFFHIEGVIFSGVQEDGSAGPLLIQSTVVSVRRIPVPSTLRQAFETQVTQVVSELQKALAPYVVTGGWRIEKENEETDEYVLFCGWPNKGAATDPLSPESVAVKQLLQASGGSSDLQIYREIMR